MHAIGPRPATSWGVDDEVHLSRGQHGDGIFSQPFFADLGHQVAHLDAVAPEVASGTQGGGELETKISVHPSNFEALRLVAVCHREEHRSLHGQSSACRHLALHEGEAEVLVHPHDLAGGAHLRAEQRVDAGESVEREDCFLHAHVRGRRQLSREESLGAQFIEGRSHHDPSSDHRPRHASCLGDEGHRATRSGIGFEHEDVFVFHRVLHVQETNDLEFVGQRSGVAGNGVEDRCRQGLGWQGAGRVARVHSGFFHVLHDPGNDEVAGVIPH